jgi:hypothetical protein
MCAMRMQAVFRHRRKSKTMMRYFLARLCLSLIYVLPHIIDLLHNQVIFSLCLQISLSLRFWSPAQYYSY